MKKIVIVLTCLAAFSCASSKIQENRTPAQTGNVGTFSEIDKDIVYKINPIHEGTKFFYSAQNAQSFNGICRSLGFSIYVNDTAKKSKKAADVVVLDKNGLVKAITWNEPISEIGCKGLGDEVVQPSIVTVKYPIHLTTKTAYSARSAQNVNGVCKSLGYASFVDFSLRDSGQVEDTVVVDENGQVKIVKDHFTSIKRISCFN